MFQKMSEKRKNFDETKYMSFLIKDDELLEKYKNICARASNILAKDLIVNQYIMKTSEN